MKTRASHESRTLKKVTNTAPLNSTYVTPKFRCHFRHNAKTSYHRVDNNTSFVVWTKGDRSLNLSGRENAEQERRAPTAVEGARVGPPEAISHGESAEPMAAVRIPSMEPPRTRVAWIRLALKVPRHACRA